MQIVLIAAISNNFVIGKNGSLPWKIEEDLDHFRKLTLESSIIMGRDTFKSIGKALPKRNNIMITSKPENNIKNVIQVNTKKKALEEAKKYSNSAYVIGGERVYRTFLPLADKMQITEIDVEITGGDAFFPKWRKDQWEELSRIESRERDLKYSFVEYIRK